MKENADVKSQLASCFRIIRVPRKKTLRLRPEVILKNYVCKNYLIYITVLLFLLSVQDGINGVKPK